MADPYRFFRIEGVELTDALEASLLELERGETSAQVALATVLRHAHTLKGAARVVRHTVSANLAHALEDLLVPVRDTNGTPTPELVSQALGIVDHLRRALAELGPPRATEATGTSAEASPTRTLDDPPRDRPETPADRATVQRLLANATSLADQLTRLEPIAIQLGRVRRRVEVHRDAHPRARGAVALAVESTATWQDDLGVAERELSVVRETTHRLLGQLREGLERLRLRESEDLRGSLERTARDAALAASKRVRLEFHGGGLRIEPELHAAASRALLQAVKNAVVHGIESQEERLRIGKPHEGRVSVTVARQGSTIVFACEDDGRGLDLEALRKLLAQRMPPGSTLQSDEAVIEALLSGGVSTASSVTAVAGRGIGLDLARDVAHGLGASLRLQNRPGQGVRLELVAKAQLAASPALLVEADGIAYALPLDALFRTARQEIAARSEASQELVVDGQIVPFRPLAALLEPNVRSRTRRTTWTVVLLKQGRELLALGVDRLLGSESVTSQPLPPAAQVNPGLAGFSVGTDGTARFLLDPAWLHRAAGEPWLRDLTEPGRPAPILVIDDSLTTRMLERSILESAGYEVELATSGEEGLQMARAKHYALFLVDVEMPGMDGFTFIETTRADPNLRTIPAILVTSRNAPEDIARGALVGARAHVVKGEFDQVELLGRIEELVAKG